MKIDFEIVEFFQSLSNNILDNFFKLITHLGDITFFIIVAAIIYWTIDKRFAYKFAITYIFGALANTLIKGIFKRPRPFEYQDTHPNIVSIGPKTSGYSFPSGHSQASATLSYSLFKLNNNKYKWFNYVLLFVLIIVPISRVYLGQHFLSDVILGTIIGLLITMVSFKLFDLIGDKEHIYALYLIPLFLLALLYRVDYIYIASGGFLAFTIGYYIEKVYVGHDVNTSLLNKVLKVLIALIVILAIKEGFKLFISDTLWGDFIRYFIIGLWASLGAPWVFKHVFKNNK